MRSHYPCFFSRHSRYDALEGCLLRQDYEGKMFIKASYQRVMYLGARCCKNVEELRRNKTCVEILSRQLRLECYSFPLCWGSNDHASVFLKPKSSEPCSCMRHNLTTAPHSDRGVNRHKSKNSKIKKSKFRNILNFISILSKHMRLLYNSQILFIK